VVARRPSTLPNRGEIFLDARGDERALRVSWHAEAGLVVLSLWRGNACSGSFRLAVAQVPDLMEVLRAGLRSSYQVHRPVLERTGDRAC
jgi:hypothetical protein